SAATLFVAFRASLAQAVNQEYLDHAIEAYHTLQSAYYSQSTGIWGNAWWQSGEVLSIIGDLAAVHSDFLPDAKAIYINTLAKAPGGGGGPGFLNAFYDDEGWWAMGWIRAYDVTHNQTYLATAIDIFDDMTTGLGASCGGIWWSKDKQNNAAISNELFLDVAASLANRVSYDEKQKYLKYALDEWDFLGNSAMMAKSGLVLDGLNVNKSSDMFCNASQDTPTFTYNQGVILKALVELNKAKPNPSYLEKAADIAKSALEILTEDDILIEYNGPPLDPTGAQFKGAFVRNLMFLQQEAPNDLFADFLRKNADSIWENDRDSSTGILGPLWQGPFKNATMPSHNSALSCLLAAA
ncbi:glycoside hydrolase family 76 protein, partial [Aulographum hederae CBS 113979]